MTTARLALEQPERGEYPRWTDAHDDHIGRLFESRAILHCPHALKPKTGGKPPRIWTCAQTWSTKIRVGKPSVARGRLFESRAILHCPHALKPKTGGKPPRIWTCAQTWSTKIRVGKPSVARSSCVIHVRPDDEKADCAPAANAFRYKMPRAAPILQTTTVRTFFVRAN